MAFSIHQFITAYTLTVSVLLLGRLVAVFTELGQRGGPLTLVGKVALLWGGLRGAMSLADRLLAFFRIKDRPLHERYVDDVQDRIHHGSRDK